MSDEPNREKAAGEAEIHGPEDREREAASPPAVIRQIERIFAGRIVQPASVHHPLFDKFEPEHVTQFLGNSHAIDMDKQRHRREGSWFRLGYALIFVAVFIFLTVYLLPDYSDIYFEILKGVAAFAAGFAGGYGFKAYRDRRQS